MSAQVATPLASNQLNDENQNAGAGTGKRDESELIQPELEFPARTSDPSSCLTPLRDDQSAYASVAKACLQLCQFAGHGSNTIFQDTTNNASSDLFHDPSYVTSISTCIAALQECMQSHKDRRCRILACETLAIVARSAYARIRHSPLLYSVRDPAVNRLEDEIGTDVTVALATVVLDDEDDGVSASAMEAIGTLILSSSTIPGTVVHDELLYQIQSIAFGRSSPYAPTLRAVVDEDPSIPMAELQIRVQENVLSPRLLQILDRISQYSDTAFVAAALPCVTACLIHIVRTTPATLSLMDRAVFSKRWSEVDARNLVDTAVNALVLPLLQTSTDGAVARAAALSGLRLANACPHTPWAAIINQYSAVVLCEDLMETDLPLEQKLAGLAAAVIACRALPLAERTARLVFLVQQLVKLPASMSLSSSVSTAGLLISWQGWKGYRLPTRVGLFTEMALCFFVDDHDSSAASDHFETFLSAAIQNIDDDEGSLSPIKDEMLLVLATVALDIGRSFRLAPDGTPASTNSEALKKWFYLSWSILRAFVPSVLSGPKLAYLDEDVTLSTAGLTAYVQLLQDYLHGVGLLEPSTSVSLKLATNACPPHVLWDRMMDSAALLSKFETSDKGPPVATTKLMDELVAQELHHGVPSHHMRLFLLTLAADHWVQYMVSAAQSDFEAVTGTGTLSLNVKSGKDIITALSPQRIVKIIYASHVPIVNPDGRPKRDSVKKLAGETVKMCVACIENIALTAVGWRRRFGGSDAKQLISAAVASLQAKADDMLSEEIVTTIILPVSEAAIRRIQSHYESGPEGGTEFSLSELVIQPVKTKIKPLISSTKPAPVSIDAFQRGFWMQLCRQIVISRTRHAIYSSTTVDSNVYARAISPMRLTIPPVNDARDGRQLGTFGNPLAASDVWVKSCSAASDATQITMAATPQRLLRLDGEDEFRIGIFIRIFNMTAIDFMEGICLEVSSTLCEPADDTVGKHFAESLNMSFGELMIEAPLPFSTSTVYRQEVKAGDSLTWAIALGQEYSSSSCALELRPSVIYPKMNIEPEESGLVRVSLDINTGATVSSESVVETGSKSGEDDFLITSENGSQADTPKFTKVVVAGDLFQLPPMAGLQPCRLVFFVDRCGDYEAFRFLWFRMTHQLPPVKLERKDQEESRPQQEINDPISKKIATMSKLNWPGEAIPGGFAASAWAFSTLSGHHILCIFAVSDDQGNNPGRQALYFRSDSRSALFALVSSPLSRKAVVNAMLRDLVPSA